MLQYQYFCKLNTNTTLLQLTILSGHEYYNQRYNYVFNTNYYKNILSF